MDKFDTVRREESPNPLTSSLNPEEFGSIGRKEADSVRPSNKSYTTFNTMR